MADSYLAYQNPSAADKKLDSESLSVGAETVERERVQIAGASALEIATVKNSNPSSSGYGLVTRNIPYVPGTLGDGSKNVTAAGTREALASSTACRRVTIQGKQQNTDVVVVGGSTVVAAESTRRGIRLLPGSTITIETTDLANIYIDAAVSGDGVTFIYEV